VSIPGELWEELRLRPDVMAERADFLAGYAQLDEPWPGVRDLIRLAAGGQLLSDDRPVVDLLDERDDDARTLASQLEALGQAETMPPWARIGERASAWRESAAARLLTDAAQGRAALLRAGALYRELGLPFGPLLLAATGESAESAQAAARQLSALVRSQPVGAESEDQLGLRDRRDQDPPPGDLPGEGLIGWQQVSMAPTQQVAMLLTVTSDVGVVDRNQPLIRDLREAPQATGITPVGTTAQPIALWWTAGLGMAAMTLGDDDARADVLGRIRDLAQAHGRQLSYAQLDTFHWSRVQASVDLVDLHLAALVALSDRVLRRLGLPDWNADELEANLPPLARISVTVGLNLSRAE